MRSPALITLASLLLSTAPAAAGTLDVAAVPGEASVQFAIDMSV